VSADLVIGAVIVPGASGAQIDPRRGLVCADAARCGTEWMSAIDQGGCGSGDLARPRPTAFRADLRRRPGGAFIVWPICLAPSARKTRTAGPEQCHLAVFVLALANKGVRQALERMIRICPQRLERSQGKLNQ